MAIQRILMGTLLAVGVMAQALAAPNPETGAGCAAFGVAETSAVSAEDFVFEATFVKARQIKDHCGGRARGHVRGCYFPDGRAFIVKNDSEAYWHEWCHAKFGPRHARWAARSGQSRAPVIGS